MADSAERFTEVATKLHKYISRQIIGRFVLRNFWFESFALIFRVSQLWKR